MRAQSYSALLITTAFFGLGAVLANIVTANIDPLLTTLFNLTIGAALLAGYLRARGQRLAPGALSRADWMRLLFAAVVGSGISLAFIITGLSMTSPVNGGFLIQLQGPAAIVASMVLLGERVRRWQVAGILLTLLGGVFVVMRTTHVTLSAVGTGDVLVFIGAVLAGVAFVPAKSLMERMPPLQLTFLRLAIAAGTMLLVVVAAPGPLKWDPTPSAITLQVVLAVTNFCLAYVTLHLGLARLKAWEAASVLQLEPAFSVLASFCILAIVPTPMQYVGGITMIVGGLMSNLPLPSTRRDLRRIRSRMTEK